MTMGILPILKHNNEREEEEKQEIFKKKKKLFKFLKKWIRATRGGGRGLAKVDNKIPQCEYY